MSHYDVALSQAADQRLFPVYAICARGIARGRQVPATVPHLEQAVRGVIPHAVAEHGGKRCSPFLLPGTIVGDYRIGGMERCPVRGAVRIALKEERRVFTPIARSSYKWKRYYARRTAVERVNSRLDVSFGFERHFIRGLAKMRCRMGLSLVVMLAMALGRVREKRRALMRSLVRAA